MEDTNIVKFQKPKQLNIGIIIFGIIFVYLIATIVMYLTAPHITVYEVRQGSILKDTAYVGLALRKELVVQAPADGYINYYAKDCSKAKVGTEVYTLSAEKLQFADKAEAVEDVLRAEEERAMLLALQGFQHDYKPTAYADTYNLSEELKSELGTSDNQNRLEQLHLQLAEGDGEDINLQYAADDGLLVYTMDGMEQLTAETVTIDNLNKRSYKKKVLSNNEKVKTGDAVYKLVTSDNWTLVVNLTEETAAALADKTEVKVNFKKDDQQMWAALTMQEVDGHTLAYLQFQSAMVRYASERYLDVELILEDETGLKIPKTAKTEKEFYVVPKTYITQGGNSSTSGVLKQGKNENGDTIVEFTAVDIYYEDEELVYLDPNQFGKNDILILQDSNDTFPLSEKRSLDGVYCINKGYAAFRQIRILCESDAYYIVEEGNSYGLSNYDHIALDSTNINEGDVVF
ncbi:MAG: HlyD family efflux transporter periplasmic adaptor subunit [Faecalimonas sp.]|nr:HlyD family efflux transporter periplasmic adaptor subunit [Faecalimonas sp.]